jgi:hypothetical protein
VYQYISGDPNEPMVSKEHTCYFHWIQSMDKYTKQHIKPKLCEWHKTICYEYKNVTSLEEANVNMWQFIVGGIPLELWMKIDFKS